MSARRFLPLTENLSLSPTAVVAGGAGFLGSFLCEKLLSLKSKIICLDNLETGKKDNLSNCLNNKNFTFIEQDINQPLKEIPSKVDYVFHLAGVEEYLENRKLSLKSLITNSYGTKNLLDLAVKNKAKFLLVSTLEVYLAYLSTKSLEENFSPFYSHAEAKRYAEALTTEYYQKYNLDARIVRIADVFGPRMNLYSGTELADFFSALCFFNDLKIPGDGLKTIYPTFVKDLVEGIAKAMFKSQTKGKVFNLIGEKTTLINFSYTLRKIRPSLKIIYVKAKENSNISLANEDLRKTAQKIDWQISPLSSSIKETIDYYWGKAGISEEKLKAPNQNLLEKKISNLELSKKENFVQPTTSKNTKPSIISQLKPQFSSKIFKISLRESLKYLLFFLLLLLFYFSFPFLSFAWHGFWGYQELNNLKNKKVIKNLDQAGKTALRAQNHFQKAYQSLDSLTFIVLLFNKKETQKKYLTLLEIGDESSGAIYQLIETGQDLSLAIKAVSGEIADSAIININEAQLGIKGVSGEIDLIISHLKELIERKHAKFTLLGKKIDLIQIQGQLTTFQKKLGDLDKLLSLAPEILGQDSRKIYLVLFQNNMELRATGGFIGSYGLFTLENGKLIDKKVEDVYVADGQLKGKVNPPDEVLYYLGQPNWYLRDSNFSPNYFLSAQRAAWFLEKETGVLANGVIAVDLSFAQKLIKAVDGVEVYDYKEKITADNLFEKAEYQAEINFFPGSTQKKNFLTNLSQGLIDKILNPKSENYYAIMQAIIDSFYEKHLLCYFTDNNIQEMLAKQNFTGEIKKEADSIGKETFNDFIMINDSNFGTNKVNYFLERKINHQVNIGKENEILETLKITYKNKSPTNSWPGGPYKNFLRLIVPRAAMITNVNLDDNKKGKLIGALTEKEIKNLKTDEFLILEASESSKKSWGVLVDIAVGETKTISFTYTFPDKFHFINEEGEYHLYVQKQPGTLSDSYQLTFSFPSLMKVLIKEPEEGIEKPQTVSYNTQLLTDLEFKIRLKNELLK